MFSRLVNERRGQQLRRLEFAHGKSIELGRMTTRCASQLRAPTIPRRDVDPVGAALAEQQDGHESGV